MQHDDIMHPKAKEHVLLTKQAEAVAKRATAAVKQSMTECRTTIGTPTWTGRFGSAGAPPPRFGRKTTATGSSSGARFGAGAASGLGNSATVC